MGGDMYKLDEIRIRGFRGFPDRGSDFTFELGPDINVLYGPNRSGKTSLLLAIDWLLFGGDAAKMKNGGYRFMKKWSMEHNLHSETTEVEAELSNAEQRLSLTRTSDGEGRVEVDGDVQSGIEPNEFLGLERRDYMSAVHLHQQVVNRLIAETASKRESMFYRLLGVTELETMLDHLDDWASYDHSSAHREKLEDVVEQRRNQVSGLEEDIEDELSDVPFGRSDCNEDEIQSRCGTVVDELNAFADRAGLDAWDPAEWDSIEAREAFVEATRQQLDEYRTENLSQKRLDEIQTYRNRLPSSEVLEDLEEEIRDVRERSDDGEPRYGSPDSVTPDDVEQHRDELEETIERLEDKIEAVESELEQTNREASLVEEASTYLEAVDGLENCPVCGQATSSASISEHLDEVQATFDADVEELQDDLEDLRELKQEQTTRLEEVEADLGTLRDNLERLADHREDVVDVLDEAEDSLDLDDLPTLAPDDDTVLSSTVHRVEESFEDEIERLREDVESKHEQLNDIRDDIDAIESMNTVLDKEATIEARQAYADSEAYQRAQEAITELAREEARMARLATAIERAREDYVEDQLGEANETLESMFSEMSERGYYPTVNVGSDLDVKAEDGRHDDEVDIRAIFNQADLNAAAVSLFLGLGADVDPAHDFAPLMLDDPVQSMDREHIEGFARALRDIAASKNRQFIVATHDPDLADAINEMDVQTRIFEHDEVDPHQGPDVEIR
jgi:DNA repair exonuclease SbcCD ATPase subunit